MPGLALQSRRLRAGVSAKAGLKTSKLNDKSIVMDSIVQSQGGLPYLFATSTEQKKSQNQKLGAITKQLRSVTQ